MDPSGTVVAQCASDTDFILANINLDLVDSVRCAMPVFSHRRFDVYPKMIQIGNGIDVGNGQEKYQFGQVEVFALSVFYRSKLTIAFTNKRCVVPGRILLLFGIIIIPNKNVLPYFRNVLMLYSTKY